MLCFSCLASVTICNCVSAVHKPPLHQSSRGRRGPLGSAILALRTFGRRWKRKNMPWLCSTPPVRKDPHFYSIISRYTRDLTLVSESVRLHTLCTLHSQYIESARDQNVLFLTRRKAVSLLRYQVPAMLLHGWELKLTVKRPWSDQKQLCH